MVKWNKVCTPISSGGMGVRNLKIFNKALLAHGVGSWKNITNGWEVFSCLISFAIGEGSRVRFWHDIWCANLALKATFPSLPKWLLIRRHRCQSSWITLVDPHSGMFVFLKLLMIGRSYL